MSWRSIFICQLNLCDSYRRLRADLTWNIYNSPGFSHEAQKGGAGDQQGGALILLEKLDKTAADMMTQECDVVKWFSQRRWLSCHNAIPSVWVDGTRLLFSSCLCPAGSEPSPSVADWEPYKRQLLLFCFAFAQPIVAVGESGGIQCRRLCHDATHTCLGVEPRWAELARL